MDTPAHAKARSIEASLNKSFDQFRAWPVLDTGANGKLWMRFVVRLPNHTQTRDEQLFP